MKTGKTADLPAPAAALESGIGDPSAVADGHHTVVSGAGRMSVATFLSRILGLVREQVFAHLFGASHAADAFNIAFRIPNLLRDLFAEGAMSAAFVPQFARALARSKKSAFELLLGVMAVLFVSTLAIAAIGIVWSRDLVALYAGAFRSTPGKFELAVGLTQSMFIFFPLVALAAAVMGALNALGSFFIPAFAPVLFNVASIFCGIAVCPLLARYTSIPSIYGMAIGVVSGGFLQFYVQWRRVRQMGLSFGLADFGVITRPFENPAVKKVLHLMIPGTIGLAATQLSILINSIYATQAGPRSVSWLNYAFRLMQFPIGIFGVSFAAATLPVVARKLAQGARVQAGHELQQSFRLTVAVNAPATAGLIALALPITQLLFQHGRFSSTDAEQTAIAITCYSLGLVGYSVVKVAVPIFYAMESTRVPVLLSFVMVGLNTFLNHVFLDYWHLPFWSLALATAVTSTLNAMALLAILRRRLPGSVDLGLMRSTLGHVLLAVGVGLSAWVVSEAVVRVLGRVFFIDVVRIDGFFVWFLQVALGIVAGVGVWWGLGAALGISELLRVQERIRRKFF